MEVGSPEWIEASLARLDELERERAQHEAALEKVLEPTALRRHNEAVTRLDAEIKSLYAQLEAFADDDGEGDDESEANDDEEETDKPQATQGDDELSAPHFTPKAAAAPEPKPAAKPVVRELDDNPFGSPSPSSFSSSSGGGGFDAPAPSASVSFDDEKPAGGGAKWAFIGLLAVAGVGVGGWFIWQDMQSKKPDAAPTAKEPNQVIKAAGVPDDTEAPPTAPSGHATISPNANQPAVVSKKKKKDEEEGPDPLTLKGGDGPL